MGEWLGEAYIALFHAAGTFDKERGNAFSTHAVACIRWRLHVQSWKRRGGQLRKLKGDTTQRVVYLPMAHDRTGGDDDHIPILAQVPGREHHIDHEGVARALATMKPREREIAMHLSRGMTLEETGRRVGISKERVRQIRDCEIRKALVRALGLTDCQRIAS